MGIKIKLTAETPEELDAWMNSFGYARQGHIAKIAAPAEATPPAETVAVSLCDDRTTGVGMSDKAQPVEATGVSLVEQKRKRRTKAEIEADRAAEAAAETAASEAPAEQEPYILINAEGGTEDTFDNAQSWHDTLAEMIENAPAVADIDALATGNKPTLQRVSNEFPHLLAQLGEISKRRRAELANAIIEAPAEDADVNPEPEPVVEEKASEPETGAVGYDETEVLVRDYVSRNKAANGGAKILEIYQSVGVMRLSELRDKPISETAATLAKIYSAVKALG